MTVDCSRRVNYSWFCKRFYTPSLQARSTKLSSLNDLPSILSLFFSAYTSRFNKSNVLQFEIKHMAVLVFVEKSLCAWPQVHRCNYSIRLRK